LIVLPLTLEKVRHYSKSVKRESVREVGIVHLVLLLVTALIITGVVIIQQRDKSLRNLQTGAQTPQPLIVDHNSVALFEQIPEEYIVAAQNMKMTFVDRSVGANISDYLTCLSYASDEVAPSRCKRYTHPYPQFSVSPSEVNWSRPGGYSRSNWQYFGWPGTGIPPELPCGVGTNYWNDKLNCFIAYVDANPTAYDVYSYQNSYLEVDAGGDISSPTGGYFVTQANKYDISDFEAMEARHPDRKFIHWTSSLARGIGTQEATDFNNQMRQYVQTNNKVLFDVADIESHDPSGNPCYDNRDGVAYGAENYSDDGVNLPAICQHYTSELYGGHLGSPSAGGIRIAKAFWVLMAQLAGWNPGGAPLPTFPVSGTPPPVYETATPPPTTPTPTSAPTSTLTPTTAPPQGGGGSLVYYHSLDSATSGGSPFNVTFTPDGKVNGAGVFNGTSSYIDLGQLSYIKGQPDFSLAVWVKPNFEETSGTRYYVMSDGNTLSMFNLNTVNGWRLPLRTTVGTVRLDISNLNWVPNTWHMIAITYDGSSVKGYWDGVLKTTLSITGNTFSDTLTAKIGVSGINTSFFSGQIDAMSIFDYALSADQVASRFSQGI